MQPTHTLVAPTSATGPARTLRDAAAYLRHHGWIQGAYYDQAATVVTPAACTVGAIGMVCYGRPVPAPAQMFDRPGFDEFEAAVSYLDQMLKDTYGQDDVYTWNDDKHRTTEDVLDVLAEVADTCEGACPMGGAQ
jgi:hypothetical protein